MLRIAIDINDVIRDYTRQFSKYYNKVIDPSFEIDYDNINDFDLFNVFPFTDENGNPNRQAYNKFKFEECAYELFGRADVMERTLPSQFNLWTQNTLRNFDEDKNPEILLVSPFEMNLSIQSTLSFLSRIGSRVREIYFPINSQTIWDKCDILITANPHLIEKTPENKVSIKINTPYNKEAKATYVFDSLCDVINDPNKTIIKLIEKEN